MPTACALAKAQACALQDARQFFTSTLYRVATPVREVTWADFLLADVLTSLAKALSDTERAVCLLVSHGSILEPHARDQVCCTSKVMILSLTGNRAQDLLAQSRACVPPPACGLADSQQARQADDQGRLQGAALHLGPLQLQCPAGNPLLSCVPPSA